MHRHLILGGSTGLGRAYASHYARKGHFLVIVARDHAGLEACRSDLLAEGAPSVETLAGDLLLQSFRSRIFQHGDAYDTIFIGGPTPPAGKLEVIDSAALQAALNTALIYPFEVARWAFSTSLSNEGELVVLSSSAVDEDLCNHDFFLSALFRRTLHQLIACIARDTGKRLTFWKPRVVATRLALHYAEAIPPVKKEETALARLCRTFGVKAVPTPDDWVREQFSRDASD